MKLLVTGANGYLGKALCPLLIEQGHALTTLTRHPFPQMGADNQVIDWSDINALKHSLIGQEVVIHLAALAHQAGKTEADYWTVNVTQTASLAQAAVEAGVKRLIFISSIKVNGEETQGQPFRAEAPPHPEDAYGRSKWAAEQVLRKTCTGTSTDWVILRPPLIWGGTMKGNLALLQRWVRWKIPLPFGGIANKRDIVSLDNLCGLIQCVIDHPHAAGQTFLVSDGVTRSTADIVRLVAGEGRPFIVPCPTWALKGLLRLPVIGPRLRKLTTNLEVDITPTCDQLGWRPRTKPL